MAVDTARFEHQVGLSGPNVRIETWMYTARVNMIPFVIPSELSVESGHFVGALPRCGTCSDSSPGIRKGIRLNAAVYVHVSMRVFGPS